MNSEMFDKAKINFEEGIKYFQQEKYDLAEISFLNSLKIIPDRLSTIGNLIKIYIKTYQTDKLNNILKKYEHLKHQKNISIGFAYKYYFEEKNNESINLCNKYLNDEELGHLAQDLLALNFKKKNNFLEALKVYRNRLKENKKNFMIYYNIGLLFFDLGKTNQANYFFKKSYKFNPRDYSTIWNISLCCLTLKDFKKGFEFYEYRWKKKNADKKKFQFIKFPENTKQLINKKILIWDEQGLGDTINFSRFVIQLLPFTKNITLIVNKKLKNILMNLDPEIKVIDYDDKFDNNFDYQIPICSLPKFLKIYSVRDIKFNKLNFEKKNLDNEAIKKDKLNIGVAWSGNPNYIYDRYRSITFNNFKKLFDFKNINFIKLSQNSKNDEPIDYNLFKNLTDYGDRSLEDVAKIILNLDLVISTDTSIIHLAGILKVKSILLLNFNSDWRWFKDQSTTCWYPSIKIIKQEKFNSWKNVFEVLKGELQNLTKKKGSNNCPF